MASPLRQLSPFRDDELPVQHVTVPCKMCGSSVRVPYVREFVHLFKRMIPLAGVRPANDLPVIAYKCHRGHVVTVPLERLLLAISS